MKYRRTKVVEITITLSEEEAEYLKDLLQNYMGGDPATELEDHQKYRAAIFDGLRDALT